jgi:pimeloyl-ACP methyl ester carboxylesterase
MMVDPGGDWGFFLDADDTLRTTDVWVVGYSWGSQTWAMVASYIRFGRVVCTSGPVTEGWPNAAWMTMTAATGARSRPRGANDAHGWAAAPDRIDHVACRLRLLDPCLAPAVLSSSLEARSRKRTARWWT